MHNGLLLLSLTSAIFLIALGIRYYFRGKTVAGYSELYSEYSLLLGPIGFGLLLYALAVSYIRFFHKQKGKKGRAKKNE